MEENKKPNNPSAYPSSYASPNFDKEKGMTLRDYFANSAMQGAHANQEMWMNMMLDRKEIGALEYVAQQSYLMADAMLKQREL